MIICPYCGNPYSITSFTDGSCYCNTCHYSFKTILDVATIPVPSNGTNIPNTNGVDKGFYHIESKGSNFLQRPEYNKLIINAKSIKINDDKISITIDRNSIDKFNAIEINEVKFVNEDMKYENT